MIRLYFSLPDMFNIWTIINAIANIVLAAIALYTIWYNIRMRDEEERARLSFSIVERNSYYCLRITNIGKKAAYNVSLKFNNDYIFLIPVRNALQGWNRIQNSIFNIEPGQCIYLVIAEAYTKEDQIIYNLHKDVEDLKKYGRNDLVWIIENGHKKLEILGKYNDKYKINEKLAIFDYIVPGVEVENNQLIDSLNKIQRGIDDYDRNVSHTLKRISQNSFRQQTFDNILSEMKNSEENTLKAKEETKNNNQKRKKKK